MLCFLCMWPLTLISKCWEYGIPGDLLSGFQQLSDTFPNMFTVLDSFSLTFEQSPVNILVFRSTSLLVFNSFWTISDSLSIFRWIFP